MRAKTYNLSKENLRRFVRAEITFEELFPIKDQNGIELVCSEGYKIGYEDILAGLERLLELKDLICCREWMDRLYWQVGNIIGIADLVGEKGNTIEEIDLSGYRLWYFKNDAEFYKYVFDIISEGMWESDISEMEEILKDLIAVMKLYPQNKNKTLKDVRLTDMQEDALVSAFGDERFLINEDDEIKEKFVESLEDLVRKGNLNAIRTKGYACYGDDHPIYSCDWETSRDCFLKLMDSGNDYYQAQAANTLGYIYYYGRCNGGVPQYDEAYKYFSLAAFFGYYEAKYKVADMLATGKGTPQNKKAAFNIYYEIYNETLPKYVECGEGVFADAALRMAGAYENGIGVDVDEMSAYYYYLQARAAIDERAKTGNFFGNTVVSSNIRAGISRMKERLSELLHDSMQVWLPRFVDKEILEESVMAKVKIVRDNDAIKLVFSRCDKLPGLYKYRLFTFPSISYCERNHTIEVDSIDGGRVIDAFGQQDITFSKIKVKDDELQFYYKKKLVLSVSADGWIIKEQKREGSDKIHRFVSICFDGNERMYDYLCDDLDVNAGDEVIVPSMNGDVSVRAVRVFEQSEADAPLEITRYKKARKK